MALHSTGAGQQAYGLWCEWAQQSDKFDLADSSRVWRSFKAGGGITLKTVYARARTAGWVEPSHEDVEPDIYPESCGIDVDEDWKAALIQKGQPQDRRGFDLNSLPGAQFDFDFGELFVVVRAVGV